MDSTLKTNRKYVGIGSLRELLTVNDKTGTLI